MVNSGVEEKINCDSQMACINKEQYENESTGTCHAFCRRPDLAMQGVQSSVVQ